MIRVEDVPMSKTFSFLGYESRSSSGSIQVLRSSSFVNVHSPTTSITNLESKNGEDSEKLAGVEVYLESENLSFENVDYDYDSDELSDEENDEFVSY